MGFMMASLSFAVACLATARAAPVSGEAVAMNAAPPSPGGATLFGLTMTANGPTKGAMCSVDPATGNVTLMGGTLPADSGTDDCRAIDSKRGLYLSLIHI